MQLLMGTGKGGRPRQRPSRPIGLNSIGAPSIPNPEPVAKDGKWFIPNPVASRLYQKSALGTPVTDGILMSAEEVMFCHWHRHIPVSEEWVGQRLVEDPDFAHRCVAFDIARSGGEKTIPIDGKWLRWSRDSHPSNSGPVAQIKWARTGDDFDWESLFSWVEEVNDSGLIPELALVDDEMDVTMYRLSSIDPRGSLTPSSPSNPNQNIGVEHLSRRFYRGDESAWMAGDSDDVSRLFGELNSRGLMMRPGFKYGCRWRVYTTPIDEEHAPWLMQLQSDAPQDWEGVCLSVRLAEGVNKGWVVALDSSGWNFLMFRRHLPGR